MRRLKHAVEQAVTPEAAFRSLIVARGFSGVRAMAQAAGVTRATVHRALSGHGGIRRDTAARIATVLGIEVDVLARMLRVGEGHALPVNPQVVTLIDSIAGAT